MASTPNQDWYGQYLAWWDTNVTKQTNPAIKARNAQYGNELYAKKMQESEQNAANKDAKKAAKKAENKQTATAVAGAVGAPVATAAGTKLAGMLGLGAEEAAKEIGKEVVKNAAIEGTKTATTTGLSQAGGASASRALGMGALKTGAEQGANAANAANAANTANSASTGISAGTALGYAGAAYGGYQAFEGARQGNWLQAGLGNAAAAAPLLMGAGPVGWAILAASLIGTGVGALKQKSRTKVEDARYKALKKAGIPGFTEERKFTNKSWNDQIRKDLAPDFVGRDSAGNWVNNKFAKSKQETDLTPDDIIPYSAFGEQFGSSWYGADEAKRKELAQKILDAQALREHHGTLDVKWNPEILKFGESLGFKPYVAPAVPQSQVPAVIPNKNLQLPTGYRINR
jgi:hypothetical protein